MLSVATNTTVVGRLRIRSKSPDPQAEQRRIGQMLRLATLHPAGLPESAMLVVRRLPDPLPSRLRVGPFDLLPDASWQRAVAAALEKLATSAAQPAYGAVPPTSDAVLFYDRAELLASLALDWMSGTLLLHWWWRELLRGSDVVTTLLRKWKESPQYVPGALDLLAKHSRAVQFVQRLPEQAVSEILEAVLRVYGVPRPRAKDTAPQKNSEDREEPPEWTASATKTQARQHVMMLQAPWLFWVPEACTPGLLPIQKMLLIQAMMLRRAPATARTVAFQKDLLRWEAGAQREAESGRREAEKTQMKMPSWASRHKPPAPQIPEQVAVAKQLAGVPAQAAASLFYGAVHEHLAANAVSVERQAQTGSEERSKSSRSRVVYGQEGAVGINCEAAGALRQV